MKTYIVKYSHGGFYSGNNLGTRTMEINATSRENAMNQVSGKGGFIGGRWEPYVVISCDEGR